MKVKIEDDTLMHLMQDLIPVVREFMSIVMQLSDPTYYPFYHWHKDERGHPVLFFSCNPAFSSYDLLLCNTENMLGSKYIFQNSDILISAKSERWAFCTKYDSKYMSWIFN